MRRLLLMPPKPSGKPDLIGEILLLIRCVVACFGVLTIWSCLWVFYDEAFLFVDLLNPDTNPYRDIWYLVVGLLVQGALGTYWYETVVIVTPSFPPKDIIQARGSKAWCYRILQHLRMIVSLFASILCWVGGYNLMQIDDNFESVTWYMRGYVVAGVFLVGVSGTLYPSINEGWPEQIDLSQCSRSEWVWTFARATLGLFGDILAWVGWDGLLSVDAEIEQVLEDDILLFFAGFVVMYLTRTLPHLVEIDDIEFYPPPPEYALLGVLAEENAHRGTPSPIHSGTSAWSERPPVRKFCYKLLSVIGYFAWLASWSGVESMYYWSGFDSPDSDKKTWWIQLLCVGAGLIAVTAARTLAFEA